MTLSILLFYMAFQFWDVVVHKNTSTEDCEFITYFGDDGFPLVHFCQLYSSCEQVAECTGCVSETKGCFYACSDNIVG